MEQNLICKSVTVDLGKGVSSASLPLIHNPEVKLVNNKHTALKVLRQQIKRLEKNPKDKQDVIESEKRLHEWLCGLC